MSKRKHQENNLTGEEYFAQRTTKIAEITSNGVDVYPHKFVVKNTFEEIKKICSACVNEEKKTEMIVQSAGRVMSVRLHSKFTFFIIKSGQETLQLVYQNSCSEIVDKMSVFSTNSKNSDNSSAEDFDRLKCQVGGMQEIVKRGDIIGFSGIPGKTRTGEMSVFTDNILLLAPCLRSIPSAKNQFSNTETIYRQRYLDLIANNDSYNRFLQRSRIISFTRHFLTSQGFLEVETPIMNTSANGAAARPFETHHNELNTDLMLRIAPELFLKMLVIGGFDRVFELGKNFRNEGIDMTHNPEFTSLEMYRAFWDYEDMMNFSETFIEGVVNNIKGSSVFTFTGKDNIQFTLDCSTPFKRVDILSTISEKTGIDVNGENVESSEILEALIKKAREEFPDLKLIEPLTISRVVDAYVGYFIEPTCINPTFIINHPVIMSPLAKDHRLKKGLTERFELFVAGKELMNGFTELNIPSVQRQRFIAQSADRLAGDDEAMPMDEDFCHSLEYGLPPTAGLGIGIDRLVMFLTNTANIKDVIFFPTMKPKEN